MSEEILKAKKLLEKNGYIVARIAHPDWPKDAMRLNAAYVAFAVEPDWKRCSSLEYVNQKDFGLVRPKDLCSVLGIDRHTLARKLKHKHCPRGIHQERGSKGRLIRLQPTQALIDFLMAHFWVRS